MRPSEPINTEILDAFSSPASAAPYILEIEPPQSLKRSNGKLNLSLNFLFAAGSSKLIPNIKQFLSSKRWIRSRNPFPSIVHPGVSALGYHQSKMFFPL